LSFLYKNKLKDDKHLETKEVYHIEVPSIMDQQPMDVGAEETDDQQLQFSTPEREQENHNKTGEPLTTSLANSVNTQDLWNYVIEDLEESEGESNLEKVADLANIPEASPAKAASRWSKRRAGATDDSLERASKMKALRNEGDNDLDISCFNIVDSCIQSNLLSVGISLGQDRSSVSESIARIKHAAWSSTKEIPCCDKKH
jgi:hypothetical protein